MSDNLTPSILVVLGVNRDRITGHGIPLITMIAFLIGSVVSISSIAWTVRTTKELPLTESERALMPNAETVWLTPLDELHTVLARSGLVLRWRDDWSRSHRAVAESLIDAFVADATEIAARIGRRALDELLATHRLWSEWLATGRVRKLAFVAERVAER